MSKTIKNLNIYLSNLNVLNAKLYQFHWYVKGENFFTLHEKFQELYEETHTLIDEVAERILMIGGSPLSTLSNYLKHATLTEQEEQNSTATEMVELTIHDYKLLINKLKRDIKDAEEENDVVTVDMLTTIVSSYEKTVWLLSAYLSK